MNTTSSLHYSFFERAVLDKNLADFVSGQEAFAAGWLGAVDVAMAERLCSACVEWV